MRYKTDNNQHVHSMNTCKIYSYPPGKFPKAQEKAKMICTKVFIFCTNFQKTSRGISSKLQRSESQTDVP